MATVSQVYHNELVQTTNATATTVTLHTAGTNSSGYFRVNVVARRDSDGASKSWFFDCAFKRNTGDATVSIQLLSNLGTGSDLLAMLLAAATVDVSGADMRIRVTGLASTNMTWYATMIGDELDM